MKYVGKAAICLAGGLAFTSAAHALSVDPNPYTAIVDRNVFNLRPPPSLTPTNVVVENPPTKITLLGIVSGFGSRQVMFKTPVGMPPKETSFMLSVGERADDFEVLDINEIEGSVRLRNHGQEEALTLEKNGMKPSAATPPPGVPGLPGLPGQRLAPPPPNGMPQTTGIPMPQGGSGVTTFGGAGNVQRPLRGNASGGSGLGGAGNNNTAVPQTQPNLTREEQMIMIEVNRKLTEKQVSEGTMPPLPPTGL